MNTQLPFHFSHFRLLLGCLLAISCSEQAKSQDPVVEHLLLELHRTVYDSSKVEILLQLSQRKLEQEPEKAFMYAQQAFLLSKNIRSTKPKGSASLYMALSARKMGLHDKTYTFFDDAFTYYRQAGDSLGVGDVYSSQGQVFFRIGRFRAALDYYSKALQCFTQQNATKKQIDILLKSSGVLIAMSQFEKSKQQILEARRLAQVDNNQQQLGESFLREGVAYIEEKRYKEALEFTREALRIWAAIQDMESMSKAWNNIGHIENLQGNHQEAMKALGKALELKNSLRDEISKVTTLNNLGISLLRLGRAEEALPYSLESYAIAEKYRLTLRLMEASATLSEIYQASANLPDAIKYERLSSAWKDSLHQDLKSEEIYAMQAQFEAEKGVMEQAIMKKEQAEENYKNLSLFLGGGGLLVAMLLLFLYFRKRQQ